MNKLIILLSFISLHSISQVYKSCEVYQYDGNDSTNKKITCWLNYNLDGTISNRKYRGYKETSVVGKANWNYKYIYKNGRLTKTLVDESNGDKRKTIYQYNQKDSISKEVKFFFYKSLNRRGKRKGWGRAGGCITTNKDYKKYRTWKKAGIINYTYDSQGNKILFDATKLYNTSQNKYKWEYDSLNRVSKSYSYNDDKLLWITEYTYFEKGYSRTRTWFDHEGNPEHLKSNSSMPQYTVIFTFDNHGREILEYVKTEKKDFVSRKITEYNKQGFISKTVHFNKSNQPDTTHLYVYK